MLPHSMFYDNPKYLEYFIINGCKYHFVDCKIIM